MNIIAKKSIGNVGRSRGKNGYDFRENFPKNGTYWKIFTKLFTMQERIP
jgi:hypothetical protein